MKQQNNSKKFPKNRKRSNRWRNGSSITQRRGPNNKIDFTSVHKTNTINESKITKNQLKAGHIVRFDYRGKNVHERRPLVLILNPQWKSQLHGIALRLLSEKQLLELSRLVQETISDKMKKVITFGKGKNVVTITNPQAFYRRKIKPWLRRLNETPYRTYNKKGISNTRIIDYKFKDMDVKTSSKL